MLTILYSMANNSIKYLLQGAIVVAMVTIVLIIVILIAMPVTDGYTPTQILQYELEMKCQPLRDKYINLIKILLQVRDTDINKSIPSVSLLLKDPMLSDIPITDVKMYQDALNKLNQEYIDNSDTANIVGRDAIDKFENEHPFKSIDTLIVAIVNDYRKECAKIKLIIL